MYSTLAQEVNHPLYPNDTSPCSVIDQGSTPGGPLSCIQTHSSPLSCFSYWTTWNGFSGLLHGRPRFRITGTKGKRPHNLKALPGDGWQGYLVPHTYKTPTCTSPPVHTANLICKGKRYRAYPYTIPGSIRLVQLSTDNVVLPLPNKFQFSLSSKAISKENTNLWPFEHATSELLCHMVGVTCTIQSPPLLTFHHLWKPWGIFLS